MTSSGPIAGRVSGAFKSLRSIVWLVAERKRRGAPGLGFGRLYTRAFWARYGFGLTCAAVVVLPLLGAGILIWDMHDRTIADYRRAANMVGTMLAERTERYVQVIDGVLQELQVRVGMLDIKGPADFQAHLGTPEIHNLLRERMQNLPPANGFILINPEGRIASSSRHADLTGHVVPDSDFLRYFASNNDPNLFVSVTRKGRITGAPTIFIARRINAQDGRFLGVAVGAIDVSDLDSFHRAINTLPGQTVTLLRRDGVVLTRDPDPTGDVGRRMAAESPWYGLVQAGGGTYRSPGYLGGNPAIVSVHPLPAYPLVIDVSVQERVALAVWRREAELIGIGAGCAAIVLLLLVRLIGRQFSRLAEQNALLQQTAAALHNSERDGAEKSRMLETTLEHMDQGLIMVDSERAVPICNRRAMELLELPPDLMASRPKFADVLAFQWQQGEFAGSDEVFRSFVQNASLMDGPRNYERRRPNGRVLEVRTTWLPDGEAVRTFTDVTERRDTLEALALAKDQAESANRAKTEFLANMSHELRTPLNAIIGFSELIRDQAAGPIDATYVAYAEDINAGGRHLLDLVNDLLDMSKIEAGRYDLVEERVNLDQLLQVCQRMMMPQPKAGTVTIIRDPGLADVMLQIDRRAVHQVLLNLLDNAVKFSPAGSTTVVRAEATPDGGVAVLVSDNGIGIAPEALRSLFEPFRQVDPSISRRFGGTGLGLTISRKLMMLMGGTLEIASRQGEGTTVSATFPPARVLRPARAEVASGPASNLSGPDPIRPNAT